MREAKPDLLTTSQAGRILDCVPDNVRKLAIAGKLPIAVTVGRGQRLFDRNDVEQLAAKRLERRGRR